LTKTSVLGGNKYDEKIRSFDGNDSTLNAYNFIEEKVVFYESEKEDHNYAKPVEDAQQNNCVLRGDKHLHSVRDDVQYKKKPALSRWKRKLLESFDTICHICGKRVLSLNYQNHVSTHTVRWKNRYISRYQRRRQESFDTICYICGKRVLSFKYPCHLKTHKVRVSLELKCDICNLTFSNKTSFVKHKNVHSKIKPKTQYYCEVCGKGVSQLCNLKSHMAVHTGEKKVFTCGVCRVKFSSWTELKKHKKEHALDSIKCKLCGATFTQQRYLKVHYLRTHFQREKYLGNARKKSLPANVK